MTKQNLFHVGIPEHKKVRKSLLEATRATISCLQRYEKFKSVREEKQAAIEDFSKVVKEIYALDTKLNNTLPKLGIKTQAGKKKKITKKSTIKKEQDLPDQFELEALEKDLAKIDNALSKIK